MNQGDTRQAILAAARRMVQANGYAALSFRDLALAVGVKSSSVHYHFPTKGDLGAELARRYTAEMGHYLGGLMAEGVDLTTFMRRYTDVFRGALENDNRMCMCGIMAAERDELPEEVRVEVSRFSDTNVEWLAQALASGAPGPDPSARALAIYAAVEGAQLVARGFGDIGRYDRAVDAYRASGLIP